MVTLKTVLSDEAKAGINTIQPGFEVLNTEEGVRHYVIALTNRLKLLEDRVSFLEGNPII